MATEWCAIFEKKSFSDVKTGRSSPICKKKKKKNQTNKKNKNKTQPQTALQILEQFQKTVPQHKLAMTVNHNLQYIMSPKDSEDRDKSMCTWDKGQINTKCSWGSVPQWHCIKNRHKPVMKIIAWAQEHIQKTLFVNTVRHGTCKC